MQKRYRSRWRRARSRAKADSCRAPRWTVLNECSLLFYDREQQKSRQLRPDRVITDGEEYIVIDFKFGTPKEEYHTQVREYMHLLSEMGHSRVKGYLWFVYSNKIEEVK